MLRNKNGLELRNHSNAKIQMSEEDLFYLKHIEKIILMNHLLILKYNYESSMLVVTRECLLH